MSNSIGLRLADLVGHLDLDSAVRRSRAARASTVVPQEQRDQTNARRRALRAQRESTS